MERIFVVTRAANAEERAVAFASIERYMYGGWDFSHYGPAPEGTGFEGWNGFYFNRNWDGSGPGFGVAVLRDRLASGLWASLDVSDGGA